MSVLLALLLGALAGALVMRAAGGRRRHAELEYQAFHDPLTGLANRALFLDRVDHALKRRAGNVAVLYLDLDDFKPVNDRHGHEAGDRVLCETAARLRGSLRAADTAARLGGDEFAVLLVDIPEEHIAGVADRVLHVVGAPFELAGGPVVVRASLGVGAAASGTVGADELVRNADAAMYASKRGGKGAVSVFEAPEPVAG